MSKYNRIVTVGQMNKAVARSHQLQSEGVDYQEAAAVACQENNIPFGKGQELSDEYAQLTECCGPGCYCGFCKDAFPFNPETDKDYEPLM